MDDPAATAQPPTNPSRPALSSFMEDDWMFGCQKPSPDPTQPPPRVSNTVDPPIAPDTSLGALQQPAIEGSSKGQLQSADGQKSASDRQSLATNWQNAACSGQASVGDGVPQEIDESTQQADEANEDKQSSTSDGNKPWTMSVPALRSSVSFANALPPIPVDLSHQQQAALVQEQHLQHATAKHPKNHAQPHGTSQQSGNMFGVTSAMADHEAKQNVDASVSEWLSQQVGGELRTGMHRNGRTGQAEVATAVGEQDGASSNTSCSSDERADRQQVWHRLTDSICG